MVAVLSFTRAVQRLFEQAWELDRAERPQHAQRAALDRWALGVPRHQSASSTPRSDAAGSSSARPCSPHRCRRCSCVWSGRVLSAKRIARMDLIPFGILGSALLAAYSVGATVYLPHLFSTYATRYGVIGAVFAMISALFCVMVVVVGSAAAGREIADELRPHPARRGARRGRGPAPVGPGHRSGTRSVGEASRHDRQAPKQTPCGVTTPAQRTARDSACECCVSRSHRQGAGSRGGDGQPHGWPHRRREPAQQAGDGASRLARRLPRPAETGGTERRILGGERRAHGASRVRECSHGDRWRRRRRRGCSPGPAAGPAFSSSCRAMARPDLARVRS